MLKFAIRQYTHHAYPYYMLITMAVNGINSWCNSEPLGLP